MKRSHLKAGTERLRGLEEQPRNHQQSSWDKGKEDRSWGLLCKVKLDQSLVTWKWVERRGGAKESLRLWIDVAVYSKTVFF